MHVQIRPVQHLPFEQYMGHCTFWPVPDTDAISCTYNMDGYTPMTAVLRALRRGADAFKSDRLEAAHHRQGVRVITHGDTLPNLITSARTPRWDSDSDMAVLILHTVETHYCKSLCMTHFNFINGHFPAAALESCLLAALLAPRFTKLERIVVDVDARHWVQAQLLSRDLLVSLKVAPFPLNPNVLDAPRATAQQHAQEPLKPVYYTPELQQAAESGDVQGMTELGQYYRQRVPVLAYKWLSMAAVKGCALAYAMRSVMQRNLSAGEQLAGMYLADQGLRHISERRRRQTVG